ncbi:MAG: hypothetical protein AAFQ74_01085 [Cyanobacteria bacterium J06623_4]
MSLRCSHSHFIHQANLTIHNALNNPEILSQLSTFGYTATRIREGLSLCKAVDAAQIAQQSAQGDQISATAALNAAWRSARESYMPHVKIARIAFKGYGGIATELALTGRRKQSLDSWLAQSSQLYINALASEEILTGLKQYGITTQKLKAAQAKVMTLAAASALQKKRKGEAKSATEKRDQCLAELRSWLSDFRAVAKIALSEAPQRLESLGILQRSA